MKLDFLYGNHVILLPEAVIGCLEKATKKDIKVLLALASMPLSRVDLSASVSHAVGSLSMTEQEIEASIAFWRGAGVLDVTEDGYRCVDTVQTRAGEGAMPPAAAATLPKKGPLLPESRKARPVSDRGLPVYSSDELANILETRADFSALVDACQQTLGKIFNTAEVGIIAGLIDHLGIDGEYVLLLISHCVRMDKKSLRYVAKTALSLYDEDITDAEALEERLRRIEEMASATGKLRSMFGISSRALTAKEKAMFEKWVCTMKYDDAVLRRAYEVTVDATGKASVSYANTVLERWHAEGYRTVEDVDKALAEYRRKKTGGSSFDADDFFEAALKHTYGEQ